MFTRHNSSLVLMPTKKTTKKATKKVATKVAKNSKKPLKCATDEQCFWVVNGTVLSNLVELKDALDAMSEEVFAHHVTKEKNDFAEWIEHVLDDAELATKVRKSKKPKTTRQVVVSRLRIYAL